jgi:hypothetical protein
MSDFLRELVSRSFAAAQEVRPKQPSLFESTSPNQETRVPGPDVAGRPEAAEDLHEPAGRISRLELLGPTSPRSAVPAFTLRPAADGPAVSESAGAHSPPSPASPVSGVVGIPAPTASPERRREVGDVREETHPPLPPLLAPGANISPAPEKPGSAMIRPQTERNGGKAAPFPARALRATNHLISREPSGAAAPEGKTEAQTPAPVRPAWTALRPLSSLPQSPDRTHPAPEAQPGPASINVTIGRVEVRATVAPTPAKVPRSSAAVLSLDEYLRRRARGDRR